MSQTLEEFNQLADAEEYFEFFSIPYDPKIVNVNRLHILKKFAVTLREKDARLTSMNEKEKLNWYRDAFQQAYELFITSNSLEQKLFKVFNEKPQNVVMLSEIGAD